jgi:hypothetical protein
MTTYHRLALRLLCVALSASRRTNWSTLMKNALSMSMMAGLVFALLTGCTTNVENPKVDQTGRTGDTTCVADCNDSNTTCVAKCSDDTCKASCKTTLDMCTGSCTTTDGG